MCPLAGMIRAAEIIHQIFLESLQPRAVVSFLRAEGKEAGSMRLWRGIGLKTARGAFKFQDRGRVYRSMLRTAHPILL